MGSRFIGVPLSATEMAPKIVPTHNNNASTGIRAPITVDESDFEYSGSSRSRGNSSTSSDYSGSETESERSESGGDELETDTETPYVAEEVNEKTRFVREYAFPRPSSESKESVQETRSDSSSNQRGFSRPSMRKSGEGFAQESVRAKNAIFRPFVRIQDKRSDDNSGLYLSESDEPVEVDVYVPKNRRFRSVVPVALISRDSDDDSLGSEVSEDDDLSGAVRVPSIELLKRVNSAPKARISELDVEVDSESLVKNETEVEFVEDLVIDNVIMNSNGEIEKDNICVEGSSATIQDEVSDAESRADSFFAGEEHMPLSEHEKNGFDVHLNEEIQEFDPRVASMDLFESVLPVNISFVPSSLEHDGDFGEVALYDSETKGSESSCEDVLESDKNVEKEILESDKVQSPAYNLFCSIAALDKSVDQGVEIKDQFAESPDILIQIKQGNTSDQETGETNHIDQFTAVSDASTSNTDTKAMAGNMKSQQEVVLLSSEEILRDQAIDGLMTRAKSNNAFTDTDDSYAALSEGEKKRLVKIHLVRVKYLRLLHRLGFSPEDSIATQVLYQLTVAEAKVASRVFDLDYAEEEYTKFKLRFNEEPDFSLNILVIGKTGVGKSATINSIFGKTKTSVSAFQPITTDVKEINGIIHGVKIKVFDTPGLRISTIDQSTNQKILKSIKKTVKKCPPDVVLYVDRLDTNISNLNDLPMFKAVAKYLGSSIWSKSIVVLTHASSLPPDGSEGVPLSYEALVSKWSQAVRQLIGLSCGEMNSNPMAAVSSVENNPFSEHNKNGDSPSISGEKWRSKLLLLCYSVKTLSEAHSIVSSNQTSFFLSSLLQSNVHCKLSNDPTSDNAYSDAEARLSDYSYQEKDEDCEYILPFKPLTRSHIAKREHVRRLGGPINTWNEISRVDILTREIDTDDNRVAVFLQDMEPSPRFLARPVLSSHGWDHDRSYDDGVLVEYELDIASHVLKAQTMFRNFNKNMNNAGISFTYPIDENQTSLGLSFMRYGDELESRFSLSRRNWKLKIGAGLNSTRSSRICIKMSCLDHQLQLAAVLPIASAIFKKISFQANE